MGRAVTLPCKWCLGARRNGFSGEGMWRVQIAVSPDFAGNMSCSSPQRGQGRAPRGGSGCRQGSGWMRVAGGWGEPGGSSGSRACLSHSVGQL